MFLKACCFIFTKIKWGGASPLSIPHPLERFLLKKENGVRVKGGRPVNGIASELPMQRIGTFITFFDNGNE